MTENKGHATWSMDSIRGGGGELMWSIGTTGLSTENRQYHISHIRECREHMCTHVGQQAYNAKHMSVTCYACTLYGNFIWQYTLIQIQQLARYTHIRAVHGSPEEDNHTNVSYMYT